jgi:hypothetical protein
LLGKTKVGRSYVIQQSLNNTLSVVDDNWKYIETSNGPKVQKATNMEMGNDPKPQLYDLAKDIGEKVNVADKHAEVVSRLDRLLNEKRGSEGKVANNNKKKNNGNQ